MLAPTTMAVHVMSARTPSPLLSVGSAGTKSSAVFLVGSAETAGSVTSPSAFVALGGSSSVRVPHWTLEPVNVVVQEISVGPVKGPLL